MKTKIINFNQTDGITISDFITNLDLHKKVLLLLGGLSLPFDDASVVLRDLSPLSLVKLTNCAQRSYVSLRHHMANEIIFVTSTVVSFFNFSF